MVMEHGSARFFNESKFPALFSNLFRTQKFFAIFS